MDNAKLHLHFIGISKIRFSSDTSPTYNYRKAIIGLD